MMKIVFLDAFSIGNADVSVLSALGEYISYDNTSPEQVVSRCLSATVVITNKVKLMKAELEALPTLKLICIAATGMNNVDLEVAAQRNIQVRNVADYSTDSVAEQTFSLALGLIHRTGYYDQYVKSGNYSRSGTFTHHGRPFFELKGKKWGILGMGNIGKRVAEIAKAFGCEISYYSTSGKNLEAGYTHLPLEQLLAQSDIVSIHAPLNEQTKNLLDYEMLGRMKPQAILINVGRGGIVNETDLARALQENRLASAGVDVFEQEPLSKNNPLLAPEIADKLLLAPHIAWASLEARQRLIHLIVANIRKGWD